MIVVHMRHPVQLAFCNHRLTVHRICTGPVQRHRIKGGKHPHIRNDRNIIFRMTVTIRRHVNDKTHMKMRPVLQYRQAVFCNFLIQDII